ncbi:MAG: ABC transporter substrate-binding protein [Paracoccaceae bacterium]
MRSRREFGQFQGRPAFSSVSRNSRTTRLLAPPVDEAVGDGLRQVAAVKLLESNPRVRLFTAASNQHVSLPMHADVAQFDNNDVRLALKYAVDREVLLDDLFKDLGSLGKDPPIGPANRYRATTDGIPQRRYDPDKAKFHLGKAGLDSQSVKIHMAETAFAGTGEFFTGCYCQDARGVTGIEGARRTCG